MRNVVHAAARQTGRRSGQADSASAGTGSASTASAVDPALRVPILMYHEINDNPVLSGRLAVPPGGFAEQLSFLKAEGYQMLTAGQVARALREPETEVPAKPAVLTFDDGFADFYQTVLPLLSKYGFTATLFVTSGWVVGCCPQAARSGPPGTLNWEQLKEIAAAGIEVAAHSVTHPQLDQLPADAVRQEVATSKNALEERLGLPVTGMAYPFGYSSRLVRATVCSVGYEYACSVDNRLAGNNDSQVALPRLTIGRSTKLPTFARTVAAQRLPAEFAGYRMMTKGWSILRRAKTALHRVAG
jgi:peptidoglycan/xylan/chitin deacetylase (PgdA/CDA1 family)